MNAYNIMFVVLAVLILCSSIATVVTKSIIRAATYLLFVLLGTAGLYFLLGYTFLGSVQIMVYAGGIIVLYVFSILLTSGQQEQLTKGSRLKTITGHMVSVMSSLLRLQNLRCLRCTTSVTTCFQAIRADISYLLKPFQCYFSRVSWQVLSLRVSDNFNIQQ